MCQILVLRHMIECNLEERKSKGDTDTTSYEVLVSQQSFQLHCICNSVGHIGYAIHYRCVIESLRIIMHCNGCMSMAGFYHSFISATILVGVVICPMVSFHH